MRIAIVAYTQAWGGGEQHADLLGRYLLDRGHDVTLVAIDKLTESLYRDQSRCGFRIVRLGITGKPFQLTYRQWRKALREVAADTIVFERNWYPDGSVAMDMALRRASNRYIRIEHFVALPMPAKTSRRYFFGVFPGLGFWWYRQLLTCYMRSVGPHRIVCVSKAASRQLVSEHRYPAAKVVTVHNGVDTTRFQPSLAMRQDVRRRYAIPEDAILLGMVARLTAQKGVDLLLDVFAGLQSEMRARGVRLLLAGDGYQRAELECQVDRLGLRESVVFTGFTSRPWEIYAALDTFVMPSRWESLPYSLLEAMACGCTVVAMDVAGVGEVLSDPALGWLVPAGDADAFGKALLEAVQMVPSERKTLAERGRRHVIEEFDVVRKMQDLVGLVEGPASGSVV